jgi:uncharacterized membrane protein YfhO
VLSDQYYPGWQASVNGNDARIYATDLTLRGVEVPAGRSTVEFRYRPTSFRNGVLLFVLAIIAIVLVAILALYRSPWFQRRVRNRARQDRETLAGGVDARH